MQYVCNSPGLLNCKQFATSFVPAARYPVVGARIQAIYPRVLVTYCNDLNVIYIGSSLFPLVFYLDACLHEANIITRAGAVPINMPWWVAKIPEVVVEV